MCSVETKKRPHYFKVKLIELTNLTFLFSFFLSQWCDPSISTSTWSNREGVACNDGDLCTRGDTCQSGHCTATPFTCNSLCQYCNGNGCSLKTGFGFTNVCTCKIGGMSV